MVQQTGHLYIIILEKKIESTPTTPTKPPSSPLYTGSVAVGVGKNPPLLHPYYPYYFAPVSL